MGVDKDYNRKITEEDPYGEEVWENIDHSDVDPYGEEDWEEIGKFNKGDILICIKGVVRSKNNYVVKGRKYTYIGAFWESSCRHLINVRDNVTGEKRNGWSEKRFKKSLNENVDHSDVDPYGEEIWSEEITYSDIVDRLKLVNPGDIHEIENDPPYRTQANAQINITDYSCKRIDIIARKVDAGRIQHVVFFNDKRITLTDDEAFDIYFKMKEKYLGYLQKNKVPSVKVNWFNQIHDEPWE